MVIPILLILDLHVQTWALDFSPKALCSPSVLPISVNGTIILSSFLKCSRYYQFYPQNIFQIYSLLCIATLIIRVRVISDLAKELLTLSAYFTHATPDPATVHSPESSQSDLLKRQIKHAHPLSEILSVASCCSGRNILYCGLQEVLYKTSSLTSAPITPHLPLSYIPKLTNSFRPLTLCPCCSFCLESPPHR